jgi:type VI secretion system secreted protein VgrG
MGAWTQAGKLFQIDTPLGQDVLLLRGFKGTERISRLFSFSLDLLSENSSIAFSDIIGKNVTLSLKQIDGSYRYLNGIISRFAQHDATEEELTSYSAEMVPWLWLLTRCADCHIFKNQSVPDIITQVFGALGFQDYTNSLQASYEPLEYCAQYRETSFNFVSRLMEQYGIFYFFKHEQGKHTLVMADSSTAHSACPVVSSIPYVTDTGGPQGDVIIEWQLEQELRTGKYTHTDYNFETPSTSLMASVPTVDDVGGNSNFEKYDFFGEHKTKDAGDALAKIRMQEEEAQHLLASGKSHCRMFVSGYKFTLEDHPRSDMNADYVLTEIQHTAATDSYGTQGSPEGEFYLNTFTCIPLSVPFRPLRLTPRPASHSLYSAVVIGSGEINTDSYGRIQVQFPWDRDGTGTYWARVTQVWAGNTWGALFIPRVGQEVYVDFEEGNFDHPVIVGSVYNANQMPPGSLPGKKNISGFRTRSTEGGGDHNANVLTFDDTMGSEVFYMRAEKDMAVRVENNEDYHIYKNQTITVDQDRTETVTNGNESVTIKTGTRTHTVKGDESLTVQTGNRSVTVSTGNDSHTVSQGNRSATVSMGNDSLTVSVGNHSITVSAGSSSVTAMQSIKLSVGPSSIEVTPSGVTISAPTVSITGDATVSITGSAEVSVTGGMVSING